MLLLLLACTPIPTDVTSDAIEPLKGGGLDTPIEELPEQADTGPWQSEVETPELPPGILFNEVMSANKSAWSPDFGGMPDWIELYNPTMDTVAMSRIAVRDGSGQVWYGSAGDLLPQTWYILYADGTDTGDHTPFTLSASGDDLTLLVDGLATDRIALGELPSDVSWARFPDGGGWDVTIDITPGESNGLVPSESLDPSDNIWGLSMVHRVDITLDAATARTIGRSWVQGGFMIDGVNFDPAAMRLRGSMTYQPITGKAAFKIDLNDYVDTDYRGIEGFNILNMYYEASLAREYLGYKIFREFGVPAARNSYTELWVNGDYLGLYLLSELYDDVFLDDWYGSQDGFMLWEPESGDFSSNNSYWNCEEGPCDAAVINPIGEILQRRSYTDADVAEMEQYLDLDNALREIAVELAIGQWDGYCSPHNYRVAYNPATQLVQLIPSSLDLTFDNMYSYGSNLYTCSGKILSFCLNNATCAQRYDDLLLELADYIENSDLVETQDEIYAIAEPYMAADEPRDQYTLSQFESNQAQVRDILASLPSDIRAEVAAH